ncbi:MAG: HEAT repeat domain-containing protein [Planctomycetota bacterium]|jgi:HEAT repeat protein
MVDPLKKPWELFHMRRAEKIVMWLVLTGFGAPAIVIGLAVVGPLLMTANARNTQEVLDWLALKDWASRDASHAAPHVGDELTYDAWLEQGAAIRDVGPILNRLLERRDQRVFPAQVANALAFLGDASSVPILIDAAGSYEDEYAGPLRLEAVFALGRLGDPRAIPRLCQVLKDDESVNARANAANSLGSFDTPEVREALQNALKDDSDFVRSLARASLAKLDAASGAHGGG